jgi:hypothetical protein
MEGHLKGQTEEQTEGADRRQLGGIEDEGRIRPGSRRIAVTQVCTTTLTDVSNIDLGVHLVVSDTLCFKIHLLHVVSC